MSLNLSKWLLFYFPIVIPCLLKCLVTYFNVYTKLGVLQAFYEGLRGCFLEETKFDFFYSSWKYLICLFQTNYKISNFLLPLRIVNLDTPIARSSLKLLFFSLYKDFQLALLTFFRGTIFCINLRYEWLCKISRVGGILLHFFGGETGS